MIEGKCFHPKAIFFSPKVLPTSSTRSLLSFDTTRSCMTKISAEPPCVADQSIPINSHKCEEEKVSSEGKYSFVSFLFLFPYFLMHTHTVYFFLPYPHAHGLCLEGKKILFFLLLCPRTRFFSFLIIHMHEVSLQHNFFLERHTHTFCLYCPWHRRP